MKTKLSLPFVIGLGVPVLMVLALAAVVYIPGFFQKPAYNFLYASGFQPYSHPTFEVPGGKLGYSCTSLNDYSWSPPGTTTKSDLCTEANLSKLYVYNVQSDTSTEISYTDAKKLTYLPNPSSPDGYQIGQANYSGDIFSGLFGGNRDYNSWYIKGHSQQRKINIDTNLANSYNFSFISWIEK